jgi:uncharacterized caspase-like protein
MPFNYMKRTALVIGNANYPNQLLKNPANDAEDMAAKLESFGFTVHKAINCSNLDMEQALNDFRDELYTSDVGLFFFAGHGVQIDGTNYLLAIDTNVMSELTAKHSSLKLDMAIETMEKAPTTTSIVILDACRDNPWRDRWRSVAGPDLAPVYAPRGTLVAFGTSPGQKAKDGKGRNGAYTSALLQHIGATDCSVETMFKRVRNTLSAATEEKQISWEHTSLAGEFFFNLEVDAKIDDYSPTALRDSALDLDETQKSHRLIKALKSLTWDEQNAALKSFDAAFASKCSERNLFVVGRNIYQAACGDAQKATAYIHNFLERTYGLDDEKRRALLDGMLFEIFFDSNGRLRDSIKGEFFNDVFDLQENHALAPSFDFIARCLKPHAGRFYAVPGKMDRVVIDVVLQSLPEDVNSPSSVTKVYFAGQDLLRPEDEDIQIGEEPDSYSRLTRHAFEKRISEQLVVPLWRLSFKYSGGAEPDRVRSPRGWTVRRPIV